MHPKSLHILISPLDWGLGHATRCIPVILEILKAGHKITLAGYGRSLIMLKKEFPLLESIELQGFSPSYPRKGNLILHLLMHLPMFLKSIIHEHIELRKLISRYHFDIIISDNRYGLWNKNIRSILITHQVMIKTPKGFKFAEYLLYRISCLFISRFDTCWIPDFAEYPGLSGDFTHKYPLPANAEFIGPLTRFQRSDTLPHQYSGKGHIVVIISGPEPQRSIFEDLVTNQLSALNQTAIIISGKPELDKIVDSPGNLTILTHLTTDELQSVIVSSKLIVCRSGYSSLMDLQGLGVKALFIPTPGQTEQLYLAELHHNSGTVLWRKQENLNLNVDIEEAMAYPGFIKNTQESNLKLVIAGLKKK